MHLEKAVIALLFYIGFKMVLQASDAIWNTGWHIDPMVSLFIVLGTLALGVVASLLFPGKQEEA